MTIQEIFRAIGLPVPGSEDEICRRPECTGSADGVQVLSLIDHGERCQREQRGETQEKVAAGAAREQVGEVHRADRRGQVVDPGLGPEENEFVYNHDQL